MNDIFEKNHPMKDDKEVYYLLLEQIELTILALYELKN